MTKQDMSEATRPLDPTPGGKTGDNRRNDSQKLVAAIREGDSDAFTAFYMGYGDSVVRFLTAILGNLEDAKEITQETFIMLWENREKLNPHTSIRSYVGGMARNLAINLIRSRYKLPESDADIRLHSEELAGFADEKLVAKEVEILYKETLRRMPPQRRRIFEMSREEGLSYNEIAERLDISINTVKFHIKEALGDMRSALASLLILLLIR